MKQQILIIHGGDNFKTHEEYLEFLKNYEIDFEKLKRETWKETLRKKLGDNFEVITPQMPNKFNAKYEEWKIWLEKLIPFFNSEIILIGSSLGGAFIAKYLSENIFPKKIKAIFLVAAPFDDDGLDYPLLDFEPPKNISGFKNQAGQIFIFHSRDDKIVPVSHAEKFRQLLPNAKIIILENRGHFSQENFPELAENIKNLK